MRAGRVKPAAAILAVVFALTLTTALSPCPSFAAEAGGKLYIIDDAGVSSLSGPVFDFLCDYARRLSHEIDLDAAFFLVKNPAASERALSTYADEYYNARANLGPDGFVMVCDYDTERCELVGFGRAQDILTDKAVQGFISAFNAGKNFGDGVLAYLEAAGAFLLGEPLPYSDHGGSPLTLPQAGASDSPEPLLDLQRVHTGGRLPRFIDDEGLLSRSEAAALTARLDGIGGRYRFDTVVAVVHALDHRDARVYAADFYEQNGFGGELDGIILLLATDDRDYAFVTTGYGMYAFTDAGQEYLEKLFLPYLKDDRYFTAFLAFADGVQDFLDRAATRKPYDKGDILLTGEEWNYVRFWAVFIGAFLALAIASAVTSYWRAQLSSVRKAVAAGDYLREGGLELTVREDTFLDSYISQTLREKSGGGDDGGDSSGSSGSFSSSSGSSFSGRSGKY